MARSAAAPVKSALRLQYERNLAQLEGMLVEARKIAPRRYRGYSVEKLEAHVARYTAIVALSDDEMRAHVQNVIASLEAR